MTDGDVRPGLRRPIGQDELLDRVIRAVAARRLPQSLLIHGPPGVGLRTTARWIAAALQCESEERPCGACRSCRLAGTFEHPDIHVHFPMPRPKRASSRAKLREAIEKQRMERLAQLRDSPEAVLDRGETTGLYVAAVENIRAQAARRPAMGDRTVFVIEDADAMVPQSSSPEAANAFLKLLEEPPEFAFILLTSGRPDALLPTIRSRTAPLRVAPVRGERIIRHLIEDRGASAEEAERAAAQSDGVVGRALEIWERGPGDATESGARLLSAALSGDARARFEAAGAFSARGARAALQPALEALRAQLRDVLAHATGAAELPPGLPSLRGRPLAPGALLTAMEAVEDALEGVAQNLNPQATVSVLLGDMNRVLAASTREP